MTRLEKSEIAIITVLVTIVWFMTGDVANTKPLGTVLMWSAGLLLMQSLLRDLWLLGSSKKPQQEARQVSCICFESAVSWWCACDCRCFNIVVRLWRQCFDAANNVASSHIYCFSVWLFV